jgi:hypothetical protein
MLGQAVTCPACAATFAAPSESDGPVGDPPLVRPPLPADADSLRATKAGAGLQFWAHGIYAFSLALFLSMCVIEIADFFSASGPGRAGRLADVLPQLFGIIGFFVLLVARLFDLAAGALGVLAPPARLARGWAAVVVAVAGFQFLQLIFAAVWLPFLLDSGPRRFGMDASFVFAFTLAVGFWFVDVARLAFLALYWRSMFGVLRDRRAEIMTRRLAIAGPVVQAVIALAWIVFGVIGALSGDVWVVGIAGALAVELLAVLVGIGLVARLRRRLRAAVPAEV